MTEERLSEILSHWGVFNSRITEEVFADPHDKEGSNRTGIYIVKMKVPTSAYNDGLIRLELI